MDSLKRLGSGLGDTSKTSDAAIKRVSSVLPIVERVVDYISPESPYEMEFKTYRPENQVALTLNIREKVIGTVVDCGDCGTCDEETPDTWPDYFFPGVGTSHARYASHTTYHLHNANFDDPLTEIIVSTFWMPDTPGGVWQTPAPDGNRYTGFPNLGSAGYITRFFQGDYNSFGSGGAVGRVDGWIEDLGITQPWPGHESHTGGHEIFYPVGDMERVTTYKALTGNNIPIQCLSATLYSDSHFVDGQEVVTNYNLSATFQSEYQDLSLHTGPYSTFNFYINVGHAPANAPAGRGFNPIWSGPVSVYHNGVLNGSIDLGVVSWIPGPGEFDISYRLGAPGTTGEGKWSDYFCPLSNEPIYRISTRWPGDPQPYIGFLFCPFHLGILFLDTERFGGVPVSNYTDGPNVSKVEITYNTASGWGPSSSGQWTWIVDFNDYGWELTHHSRAIAGTGGILHLIPSAYDPLDFVGYGDNSAAVAIKEEIGVSDWQYQFTGYFIGGQGLGDLDLGYGPYLDAFCQAAGMTLAPGIGKVVSFGYQGLGWFGMDSPVDFYQPFTMKMVAQQLTSDSWGTAWKIWQADQPEPTEWFDYDTQSSDTKYATPYFDLYQFADPTYDPTPPPAVDIMFICQDYKISKTSPNLSFQRVVNPEFEDTDISNWALGGWPSYPNSATSLSLSTDNYLSSTHSLKVTFSNAHSNEGVKYRFTGITFKEGVEYTIGFYFNSLTNQNWQWGFGSESNAANWATTGPHTIGNNWSPHGITWLPTEDTTDAIFWFATYGTFNGTGYFDNVTMTFPEGGTSITNCSGQLVLPPTTIPVIYPSTVGGTGNWFGYADPWRSTPFLSYPSSSPVVITSGSNVEVSGKSFINMAGGQVSIEIQNVDGVWIHDVDFDTVTEPILLINCTNVVVERCRYRNITGPAQPRDGTHKGNFIQMGSVTGFQIRDIRGIGGDTEDVFSVYQSGGTASSPSIIERVHIQGLDWTSGSGTGIILGDGDRGNYVWVRNCILVNPGQVGIGTISGIGHKIYDNIVYADPRPGQTSPNVGISTYTPGSCPSGVEIFNNSVHWIKNDGTANPYWFDSRCPTPTLTNNNWDASINLSDITVYLDGGLGSSPPPAIPPPTVVSTGLQAAIDATPVDGVLSLSSSQIFNERIVINKSITIAGMVINAAGLNIGLQDAPLVITGSNVTLSNCEVYGSSGAGIRILSPANNVLIQNSRFHDNIQEGYNTSLASNVTFENCRFDHNNVANTVPAGWEAGGGKAHGTNIHFINCEADHNGGPGIWFDQWYPSGTPNSSKVFNPGALVQGCYVHDNREAGIMYEVSDGAVIDSNIVWNNGNPAAGYFWAAGILISSSRNVEVKNNIVYNNLDGISLISQNRADRPGYSTNVYVHDNTVIGGFDNLSDSSDKALLAYAQDWSGLIFDTASNNRADTNAYWSPYSEPRHARWAWSSSLDTLAALNATPIGGGSYYLTDAQKDAIIAANIP